jgi:hypothetical protein
MQAELFFQTVTDTELGCVEGGEELVPLGPAIAAILKVVSTIVNTVTINGNYNNVTIINVCTCH